MAAAAAAADIFSQKRAYKMCVCVFNTQIDLD